MIKKNVIINDFNQDEDEKSLSDIVLNSAKKKKVGNPLQIGKEKQNKWYPGMYKNAELNNPDKHLNRFKLFFRNIEDNFVGFFEKRRKSKGKGFSKRALNEILSYYKDLYEERQPSLEELHRLLVRNGAPDMANPFAEGSYEYYQYHPDNFMGADLTIILMSLYNERDDFEDDGERFRDNEQWVTLLNSIEDNEKDQKAKILKDEDLAMKSWALILTLGENIDNFKNLVHKENLEVATIETLMFVDVSELKISLKQLKKGIVRLGILSEASCDMIIGQRNSLNSIANEKEAKIQEKINSNSNEINIVKINDIDWDKLKNKK